MLVLKAYLNFPELLLKQFSLLFQLEAGLAVLNVIDNVLNTD